MKRGKIALILLHPRQKKKAKSYIKKQKLNKSCLFLILFFDQRKLGESFWFKKHGIRVMPFTQMQEDYFIAEISKIGSEVIREAINELSKQSDIWKILELRKVPLLKTTDNEIYTYHVREMLVGMERMRTFITKENIKKLVVFGDKGITFRHPERPNIQVLYDQETTWIPILKEIANYFNISYVSVPVPSFTGLKLWVRSVILKIVKLFLLIKRHFKVREWWPASLSEKRLLVIIRGESEFFTIKNVLDNLPEDIKYVILQDDILRNPSAKRVLDMYGYHYIPIDAFFATWKILLIYIKGMLISHRFNRKIKNQQIFSSRNTQSFFGSVLRKDEIIRELFRSAVAMLPETMLFIDRMNIVLNKIKPSAIVSMSMVDHWLAVERYLAEQRGIPFIALQNALMEDQYMPTPTAAHFFFTYSKDTRESLIKAGALPSQVILTGAPRHDRFAQDKERKHKIRKLLGISDTEKVILITTQPFDYQDKLNLNKELIDSVIPFVSQQINVRVFVKLHPRESRKEYKFLQQKQYKVFRLISNIDVLDVIVASDCLLSRTSTTIHSSLVAGVPAVVLLNNSRLAQIRADYLLSKATIRVDKTQDIPQALDRVFFNPSFLKSFKEYREEFFDNIDKDFIENATENVIREIQKILNNNS